MQSRVGDRMSSVGGDRGEAEAGTPTT
jgi:hypothetical protein